MIDAKGRLFGKISIIDLGAIAVILLVMIGVFFYPGKSGSIAQLSKPLPVEVTILVRSLSVNDSETFLAQLSQTTDANIIIRNQPAGQVSVTRANYLQRTVDVPQPDGSVLALPDPRPEVAMIKDLILVIEGNGQLSEGVAVLGNQQVKIGAGMELDGPDFNFRGTITGVKMAQ